VRREIVIVNRTAIAIACLLVVLAGTVARADGGAVRLSEKRGDYLITVFTSPTPLRAGPVDISVFVQDAGTGESVTTGQVMVRATPRGRPDEAIQRPATTEAATNKLYRGAVVDLPEPGWWDVDITIDGLREPVQVRAELEAGPQLPHWRSLWLWISWPAAVVVLYGVHRWLVRRTGRLNSCRGVILRPTE
jgi:hypothetical protein